MRPALLPAALGLALFISALPVRAQTPDCAPVLNASATAAETEIQYLRNNVRKPQSIGALTCLSLFASISNLSADYIVNSLVEGIFEQIISQICSALNGYWQAVLNQARCSISLGVGIGFGAGVLGGGSFCELNIGNGGTLSASASIGLGASGGGYYVGGLVPEVQVYGQ
jgi:hypothetical protein